LLLIGPFPFARCRPPANPRSLTNLLSELVSLFKTHDAFEHLACDYSNEPRLRDLPAPLVTGRALPFWDSSALYQMTFSKAFASRYLPLLSILFALRLSGVYKFGVWKGGFKAVWRVLRCNPFNPGGYDPVL